MNKSISQKCIRVFLQEVKLCRLVQTHPTHWIAVAVNFTDK